MYWYIELTWHVLEQNSSKQLAEVILTKTVINLPALQYAIKQIKIFIQ